MKMFMNNHRGVSQSASQGVRELFSESVNQQVSQWLWVVVGGGWWMVVSDGGRDGGDGGDGGWWWWWWL
jgi:creatinine amidohydrolase/Fe(II)-dependent formamide hydrolase-like protein